MSDEAKKTDPTEYVVLAAVQPAEGDGGGVTWKALGAVTATSRRAAFAQAQVKFPDVLDPSTEGDVFHAQLVPARSWKKITASYVRPEPTERITGL